MEDQPTSPQPYVYVQEESYPSEESLESASDAANAEERACMDCGDPVSVGERVAVLTDEGEQWAHPYHQ